MCAHTHDGTGVRCGTEAPGEGTPGGCTETMLLAVNTDLSFIFNNFSC